MSEPQDQHYFVVRGEINDKGEVTFMIDDDTADARFSDGLVWAKHGGWLPADDTPTIEANDNKMRELLSTALQEPWAFSS